MTNTTNKAGKQAFIHFCKINDMWEDERMLRSFNVKTVGDVVEVLKSFNSFKVWFRAEEKKEIKKYMRRLNKICELSGFVVGEMKNKIIKGYIMHCQYVVVCERG